MPFYKEFYTNDIHILLWKFSEEDNFDIEEFSNDENGKTSKIALKERSMSS